jgi:hypothetical protein
MHAQNRRSRLAEASDTLTVPDARGPGVQLGTIRLYGEHVLSQLRT